MGPCSHGAAAVPTMLLIIFILLNATLEKHMWVLVCNTYASLYRLECKTSRGLMLEFEAQVGQETKMIFLCDIRTGECSCNA